MGLHFHTIEAPLFDLNGGTSITIYRLQIFW